ncbi:hypothetical protein ACJJTC_017337 [Scirpophaga incertulas]
MATLTRSREKFSVLRAAWWIAGRGDACDRLVKAWLARGPEPRNLAYGDKQMTSRAIYNRVCVESGVRTCACAGVNALHAYLNQSESRLRTIRFVRPFTDFYKLRRDCCLLGRYRRCCMWKYLHQLLRTAQEMLRTSSS